MLKNVNKKSCKNKRKITLGQALILLIRLLFFVFYPALFATAFTGVKMLVTAIGARTSLPWNSFVITLLVLTVITICFGRIFCGFACAFGTYGDFIYAISSGVRKKRKKKPLRVFHKAGGVLLYGKYIVLLAILALCAVGKDSMVAVYSPFTTFSRFHAIKDPESIAGILIFIAITVGMALEPRFFCRFLCPMGAVFSLLPILPAAIIKRDKKNCIQGCKGCKMACPAALDIPSVEEGDNPLTGECFSCGKCRKRCPKKHIGYRNT